MINCLSVERYAYSTQTVCVVRSKLDTPLSQLSITSSFDDVCRPAASCQYCVQGILAGKYSCFHNILIPVVVDPAPLTTWYV